MKTEIAAEVQRRVSNQIFHYTRCIMLKRVTSLWGHLRIIAPGQHSFFEELSRQWRAWQHCGRFDRPEI